MVVPRPGSRHQTPRRHSLLAGGLIVLFVCAVLHLWQMTPESSRLKAFSFAGSAPWQNAPRGLVLRWADEAVTEVGPKEETMPVGENAEIQANEKKKKKPRKKKKKQNMQILMDALSKYLKSNVTEKDLGLKYRVTVELPCLKDKGVRGFDTVKALSAESSTEVDAKNQLAKLALEALDLGSSTAEASSKDGGKKAKNDKPKTKESKIVGQVLKGKVSSVSPKGINLNCEPRKVFLPFGENGLPLQLPKVGDELEVRVLDARRSIVTLHAGDVTREQCGKDPSVLDGVEPDRWLDAVVLGFTFDGAVVKVAGPSDPSKCTSADLSKRDFGPDFEQTAKVGSSVRVKLKNAKRSRVTMKEKMDVDTNDLEVGQTVTGRLAEESAAGFWMDIGAPDNAFLARGETADGYKVSVPPSDTDIEMRVLRIAEARSGGKVDGVNTVFLTARSGSLERPALSASGNSEAVKDAMANVDGSQWFDGTVAQLDENGAPVHFQAPNGEAAVGYVRKGLFTADFKENAFPGMSVRVRKVQPEESSKKAPPQAKEKWVSMSMREAGEAATQTAEGGAAD
eukprot:TRINITY_DN12179_c0_g1_i2.p1 TRINITY_DN12179_c0_g1~~TRINITY_DN12179_c0_g1_i2.p1  ORF type:complete len:567 (+),score=136.81 TRINITY_DN12179_c0_g1_i2:59-1759(+)